MYSTKPKRTYAMKKKAIAYQKSARYGSANARIVVVPTKKAPVKRYRPKKTRKIKNIPTIYNSYENDQAQQAYQIVTTAKTNGLSNGIWATSLTADNNLNEVFNSPLFASFNGVFRYRRLVSMSVRITPEVWSASTLVDGAAAPFLRDGEKPSIHWVNDDGSFGQNVAVDPASNVVASVPIDEAEKQGRRVVREGLFTRPYNFKIKCYSRNPIPVESQSNLGSQPDVYRSYSKWNINSNVQGPLANFWYGFTNVPPDFKYKVEIFYTVGFRQPK